MNVSINAAWHPVTNAKLTCALPYLMLICKAFNRAHVHLSISTTESSNEYSMLDEL